MIVTPNSIKALMTSFRKDFQGGLDGAPSQYQQIAMTVPSSSKSNTYGWLGNAPQLREWVGSRVVNQMAASAYTIANKTYEGTVGISRDDFEDDNLGVYSPMFSELGRAAAVQPDELVFGLLKDGFNQVCYDGQNFFDTDHPVYPKVDGSGAAKSVANVYQQTAGWTGDSWYLLDCSRAIKPLIFQNRKNPNFVAMTAETDPNVFTKAELVYGVDARRNVGFGFWQMAYASNKPLNADNLWAAINAIEGLKGDFGRQLALKATTLVVPTALQRLANKLMTAELVPVTVGAEVTTESNDLKDRLEVVVSGWL